MKTLALLLALVLPAFAGSADAIIKGKSASGRTVVEGYSMDVEGPVTGFKISIDGETLLFKEQTITSAIVDRKLKVAVFSGVAKDYSHFTLVVDPKTLVIKTGAHSEEIWTFEAVLKCTDPRPADQQTEAPRTGIRLSCTLNYSV